MNLHWHLFRSGLNENESKTSLELRCLTIRLTQEKMNDCELSQFRNEVKQKEKHSADATHIFGVLLKIYIYTERCCC
jgi:hypothetical protein